MFQEHQQVVLDSLGGAGATWVEYDSHEDLLWSGTTNGYVKSFYGVGMDRYVSFCRHSEGVFQATPLEAVVLSLSPSEFHCSMKTGMPLYTLREREELADMYRMLALAHANTVVVGMLSGKMAAIDIATSNVTKEHQTVESGVVGMKWNGTALVCSDSMGKVHLVDPSTLQVQHTVLAHHGSVTDLEVCGNYIVTCGCSNNKYDQPVTDPQLMVFDQRTLKPLPPLQNLAVEPHFLRVLPVDPSHILVASQMGMFQFLNIMGLLTPNSMTVNQLPPLDQTTPPCVFSVAISPSGQFIAFGDAYGTVHSWISVEAGMEDAEGMFLNPYAQPSVFPDPPEPLPHIDFDDPMQGVPLSALPLYRFGERGLLSDYWPKQRARFTRRRLAPIPPQILGQMKAQEFVGYAPKPAHLKRNQIPYVQHHSEARKDFLMEPESPMMRAASPFFGVPKPYRKTQIKYTKWGVEDFDFRHYNLTDFAGLEIHIPNAYCNSMIQVLFFLEPLRSALFQHICEKEFCLSCELNFLFGMMKSTSGETCQASNFLRAFRTLREALTLGLLLNEEEEDKADLAKLIQKWNTFVLQELHMEMQAHVPKTPPPDCAPPRQFRSAVEELFQARVEKVTICRCEAEEVQEITEMVFPLHYPSTTLKEGKPLPYPFSTSLEGKLGELQSPTLEERVSFSSVVKSSICSEQVTQAWCTKCNAFKRVVQRRKLLSLPKVLSFNCQVEKPGDKEFWRRQQKLTQANYKKPWLPAELKLSLKRNKDLDIQELLEGDEWGPQWVKGTESCVYELRAVVCHVRSTEGPGNLVAHILTSPCRSKEEGGGDKGDKKKWHLFNDFVIQPLSKVQAMQFEVDWLMPCILLYAKTDLEDSYESKGQLQFEPSVLLVRTSRPTVIPLSPLHFTPLHFHDLPKVGDLAAIDAEFVTLNQEEAEVRTDGTQTTIKPSQLSVARISCVRGWGNLEGTPFIDDYIRTQEQVVDYLTQFSGIKPGDLDDTVSSKHLTTLKTCYLKLLYMIQIGLIFVGHGLKKDFRVINIKVPSSQILDTAELFRLPDQRYFSLKFLSWYILGKRVQEGCHDSIEDARTALFLYRRYEELKSSGQLQDTLVNLYEAGREMQWKVPARN